MSSASGDSTVSILDQSPEEGRLSWVIVDGAPRPVSEFASTAPSRRPIAACPHCGQRMILKLGAIRRHHAAHRPGAECLATRPESALHLDCKFALAEALRAAAVPRAQLTFRLACPGSDYERCDRLSTATWSLGWDEVRVEHRLEDARRPDVLLLRDGVPVGAIEIVVSNAMADDKANALAELGVPWVEVDADPARRRAADWIVDQPIDVRRLNSVAAWRCPAHESERVFRARVPMVVREAPPDPCIRATVLRAARVVDLYHASGSRERFIYKLVEQLENGLPRSQRLMRGNLEIAAVNATVGADRGAGRALQRAFRADVAALRGDASCFADSPMHWAEAGIAEFIVNEAMFDRRLPDPTVLATTFPRRWFYSPQARQWFLPDDFRDVRWDRDVDDPLGPHPASDLSARTASTRPAREGSWSTLIFARRPSAAMFGRDVKAGVVAPGIVRVDVDVGGARRTSRRSLFVLEREIDDATLADAIDASSRAAATRDALWLSHPRDWRGALTAVAWLPSGADQRGRGAIVVDGVGVFHASAFLQAIARRDRQLSVANVREAMEARTGRLKQRG
jgi:hypothetical protein